MVFLVAEVSPMKRRWIIAFSVTVFLLTCAAYVAVGVLWLEARSSKELLGKLALARPGVHLSEISDRLGPQMRECSSVADVLIWGSVKDETFCRGKKLSWFYATTPPCRVIEVYTDANDVIVYATWQQL